MKNLKFISLKVSLLLLSLMFYSSGCRNGGSSGDSVNTVRVRLIPGNAVMACDYRLVQERNVSFTVTLSILNPDGSTREAQTASVPKSTNNWQDGNYYVEFQIYSNWKYEVLVQVAQDCSYCCGIGSNFCPGQSPSFLKNAGLYFFGKSIINEGDTNVSTYISLYNCDCRGC